MNWRTITCDVDKGPASRAAIGLIALASDTVFEPEMTAFLPRDGIGLYTSRIPMSGIATLESIGRMRDNLTRAAELLVPEDHLDVVVYGCTAGASLIGSDTIARIINTVRREPVAYSDPIRAAVTALNTLACGRIALLTPYIDSVGSVVADHLEGNGFELVAKASFKKSGDPEMCRIAPASIYRAAVDLGRDPRVEGVFISCTALRVAGIIDAIERDIGKPVASSNQALAWHCLRLAGYDTPLDARGRLFTLPLLQPQPATPATANPI